MSTRWIGADAEGSMAVELREITAATVRSICALEVAAEQSPYVAPVALSIAQAHFEPRSIFRAIHADGGPVGFILWRDGDQPKTVYLWRFMIDAKHQRKGHGRSALEQCFGEMKGLGFDTVRTSVVRGEHSPLGFYLSLGFIEMNETTSGGEWVLQRRL